MASVLPQKNWLLIYINTLGDALDYALNLSSKSRPANTSRTNEQLSPLRLSKLSKLEEVDELVASLKLKTLNSQEVNPGVLPDPNSLAQAPSWFLSWR